MISRSLKAAGKEFDINGFGRLLIRASEVPEVLSFAWPTRLEFRLACI